MNNIIKARQTRIALVFTCSGERTFPLQLPMTYSLQIYEMDHMTRRPHNRSFDRCRDMRYTWVSDSNSSSILSLVMVPSFLMRIAWRSWWTIYTATTYQMHRSLFSSSTTINYQHQVQPSSSSHTAMVYTSEKQKRLNSIRDCDPICLLLQWSEVPSIQVFGLYDGRQNHNHYRPWRSYAGPNTEADQTVQQTHASGHSSPSPYQSYLPGHFPHLPDYPRQPDNRWWSSWSSPHPYHWSGWH